MPGSIVIIPAEALVPEWAARGIDRFERYLAHHAAFEEWLADHRGHSMLAAAA